MMKHVYSVGQVNTYIKNMFAQDFMLRKISIKGEISNCKYHNSGHIYFSIKDGTGTMAAVMFAGNRKNGLKFRMQDGDHVVVTGSVEVYERDGRYQMYAREISPDGAGALFLKYEALKKNLRKWECLHRNINSPYQNISKAWHCYRTDRSGDTGYPQYQPQAQSLCTAYFVSGACAG
ncbi:Exodeoxyribonuclease 7 large subunit [Eubacterium plexicaudatum ASF492]|nr:Exodeoxyribonuclease 7 large subunit [Eubacterium plexicaudatum ASF492]